MNVDKNKTAKELRKFFKKEVWFIFSVSEYWYKYPDASPNDLQHAVEEVASFYDRLDGRDYDELTEAEQVAMLPMMTNPVINTFMLEVMPVLYAETNGVSLVQSEETAERAEESLWLMELVNVQSFFDIFEELSKHNAVKTKVKKPRKSSKQ